MPRDFVSGMCMPPGVVPGAFGGDESPQTGFTLVGSSDVKPMTAAVAIYEITHGILGLAGRTDTLHVIVDGCKVALLVIWQEGVTEPGTGILYLDIAGDEQIYDKQVALERFFTERIKMNLVGSSRDLCDINKLGNVSIVGSKLGKVAIGWSDTVVGNAHKGACEAEAEVFQLSIKLEDGGSLLGQGVVPAEDISFFNILTPLE